MWSAVYLLLLNSAEALRQVTSAAVIDDSGATVLLRAVRGVLREYVQEAQQDPASQVLYHPHYTILNLLNPTNPILHYSH